MTTDHDALLRAVEEAKQNRHRTVIDLRDAQIHERANGRVFETEEELPPLTRAALNRATDAIHSLQRAKARLLAYEMPAAAADDAREIGDNLVDLLRAVTHGKLADHPMLLGDALAHDLWWAVIHGNLADHPRGL